MALASYSSNQQATSHMISVLGKRSEEAVQTINLGLDLQMTMREIRPERQPTPVL
jgi:beta-lactam-binding protein with PASTA domain